MTNTDWGFFVDIESKEILPPEKMVVFTVEYPNSKPMPDQDPNPNIKPDPDQIITITTTTTTRIHNKLYQIIILTTIFILTKIGCIKQ